MDSLKNAGSIGGYIETREEGVRARLLEIYARIKAEMPDGAAEKISWGMPTFWKGRNIIHFAAQKTHIGLYPGLEAVAFFADKLTEYKTSKGAVQFPNNKPLPIELIAEIAAFCAKGNAK
ncbi:MAG: DUF1801 domain-containing protein [Clostridiales bacterium]|jgi:uncharacterized protein YdhG (YjbR/CyaY superfamily)|nr:DUF1801 domain-containing protein [Clostridiales bacterium]